MLIKGIFLDTPTPGSIRCRAGYLAVENGRCVSFYEALPDEFRGADLLDWSDHLIIPGLVDLHLHAPQYSYCGTAMDVELIQWLSRYTYPEEGRYAELSYARESYQRFTRDLLCSPTTRFCAFATLHTDATLELMAQLEQAGLQGYVGKLNMNRNSPDFYREPDTATGMSETIRWLDACDSSSRTGVLPMITPRFTPSVTDDYMQALGALAAARGLPMQSHLSENREELRWVQSLCPDTAFYGETYSRYGLFGGSCPTVMAHCIYSGEEEQALMKQNGVYIAHCPTSNENVIAGIAPAAHYLRKGFHIGLGSDVAGGHTLNLFEVMAAAIQVSKLRWRYVDRTEAPLTLADALYMATVGGGSFFGSVGLFEPGYDFDALVLDDSHLQNLRQFTPEERLERYTYLGLGRLAAKFVAGRQVLPRED